MICTLCSDKYKPNHSADLSVDRKGDSICHKVFFLLTHAHFLFFFINTRVIVGKKDRFESRIYLKYSVT